MLRVFNRADKPWDGSKAVIENVDDCLIEARCYVFVVGMEF